MYAGTSTTAYGRPGGSDVGATGSVGAGSGGSGGSSDAPSKVTLKLITTTQLGTYQHTHTAVCGVVWMDGERERERERRETKRDGG